MAKSVNGLPGMINPSPVQVLMVYYEPFQSGQTAHVLSLIRGLNKERFQIKAFIPDTLNSVAGILESAGAEVLITKFRKLYWSRQSRSSLFKLIKENRNQIVHFHSQEAAIIGRLLAKVAGAKHIFYTPQTIDIRQTRYMILYKAIEVMLSHLTDKIISVNERDRLRLSIWGISKSKLITIYNGIELSEFEHALDRSEARKIIGVPPDQPLVMQIGRMSAQKSPFDFIDGAAVILQSHPEVQFVMIGDGPLLSEAKLKVQADGLERSIRLAGHIENAYRLIPAADIVTLTSAWEGTPYTVLEAMAYAKPVVATAVNGCTEIVEHGKSGLLVPTGDHRMWANSVIEFIDHPQKANMFGQKGRQRVEEHFTLSAMIKKIENLYVHTVNDDLRGIRTN